MYITQRIIWKMILLMLVTGGLYIIYWIFITRREFLQFDPTIPTAWIFFIPIANFYLLYKLAYTFCKHILKQESTTTLYFFLLTLLMPAGEIIFQIHMNDYAQQHN
jgi:hypothetical protein